MIETLSHECKILLDDVPVQWGQKFELYYPDLPGFPIVYVHFKKENKRVYGFPITANFTQTSDDRGMVEITFISNTDLNSDSKLKDLAKEEIMNRFGASDRVGWSDIKESCNGNKEHEEFLQVLWDPVSSMHGDYLPFGRL